MRQKVGSELSWIALTHANTHTNMEINSADVATGEYKVKIESFNANY